jgi:hypothetical protein
MIEFKTIRFKIVDKRKYDNEATDTTIKRYEFQGADSNVYTISGCEVKAFPLEIADAMLSANSQLEAVVKS